MQPLKRFLKHCPAEYLEAIRGVFSAPLDDRHIYLGGGYGSDDEGFVAKA